MKRVLIITYYWPPAGGSGVQRWLKRAKYLPEQGWQPVIYTPENGEFPIEDPTLLKDVPTEAEIIKQPIVEPYTLYKKFLGMKKDDKVKAGFIKEEGNKEGWKEPIAMWIRGNLFIPDARCLWIKPSVRYLKEYLKEHPVDAIISTGPPHSMHLIAMKLKEALGIPWIADFRDPWTEIDYYGKLKLTRRSDQKHHRMEREVLTQADKVVTVSPDWARRLGRLGSRNVRVIYNGFDETDIAKACEPTLPEHFTLTYLGVLFKVRNPKVLWQALGELIGEEDGFAERLQVKLIGQVDNEVMQAIGKCGLNNHIALSPYIPHDEVAETLLCSAALLLPLMPNTETDTLGLVPAKLFEYLASGRPILCIGPENGDAARIIKETHAGVTVGFDNKEKMKEVIKDLYQKYLENGLPSNKSKEIEKYSRRALAEKYVRLLDRIED